MHDLRSLMPHSKSGQPTQTMTPPVLVTLTGLQCVCAEILASTLMMIPVVLYNKMIYGHTFAYVRTCFLKLYMIYNIPLLDIRV